MADFDKAEQLYREFHKGMIEAGFAPKPLFDRVTRGMIALNSEFFKRLKGINDTQGQIESREAKNDPDRAKAPTYAERKGIKPIPAKQDKGEPLLSVSQQKRLAEQGKKPAGAIPHELLAPVKPAPSVETKKADDTKAAPDWAKMTVEEVMGLFGGQHELLAAQLQSMGKGKKYDPQPLEADVAAQIIAAAKLNAHA